MRNATKWIGPATLAAVTVLAGVTPRAEAQIRRIVPSPVYGGSQTAVNRNWLVGPGMNIRQASYNTIMAARAYSYIPPYLLGYNPYPQVINNGPLYANPYANPYTNPYTNPYMSSYATPYANPYASSLYSTGGLPATLGGYGGGYGGGSALTSAGGLPTTAGYADSLGYADYAPSYDPYSGVLRGTADVINAQSKAGVGVERARIMHEQVKQARIENRRRLFDEIMYERAHTPTFTQRQEKAQQEAVAYSQNVAQPADIWSARALNILLNDAKKLLAKGVTGPDIDVDPETLQQINVRGESSRGNIGPLKSKRPLNWPTAFDNLKEEEQSKGIRGTIDAKLVTAMEQAPNGRIDAGIINDLKSNIAELHRLLTRNVNRLGSNEYIQAKRFLNELDDAVTALQDPNAANYFNGTYVAKGKTVKDLVKYMAQKGLRFAPATTGDENAYQALYQALAAYDIAANQKTGVATAKE